MYILCGFCTIKAPHRTTTTTVQQRQNHRWCRRRLSHLPFAKRFHSSSDTPVLSIGAPSPLPPHQGIPRLDASFSSPQCRWPVHCQNIGVDRIGWAFVRSPHAPSWLFPKPTHHLLKDVFSLPLSLSLSLSLSPHPIYTDQRWNVRSCAKSRDDLPLFLFIARARMLARQVFTIIHNYRGYFVPPSWETELY